MASSATAAKLLHSSCYSIDQAAYSVGDWCKFFYRPIGQSFQWTILGCPSRLMIERKQSVLDLLPKDGQQNGVEEEKDLSADDEQKMIFGVC